MTIETSTINVLLLGVLSLQCWIVRELFKIKTKVSIIVAQCNRCRDNPELDTNHIKRK